MPKTRQMGALSGALLAACALLAPAPARAEVNEVRIGFLRAEAARLARDGVIGMLTDGSIVFSVAPTGLMKPAAFMAKTG